jgi:hypothetical protein
MLREFILVVGNEGTVPRGSGVVHLAERSCAAVAGVGGTQPVRDGEKVADSQMVARNSLANRRAISTLR